MSEEEKPKDKKSKETKDPPENGGPPWEPDISYPSPLRENEATAGGPGGSQANPPGRSHR